MHIVQPSVGRTFPLLLLWSSTITFARAVTTAGGRRWWCLKATRLLDEVHRENLYYDQQEVLPEQPCDAFVTWSSSSYLRFPNLRTQSKPSRARSWWWPKVTELMCLFLLLFDRFFETQPINNWSNRRRTSTPSTSISWFFYSSGSCIRFILFSY